MPLFMSMYLIERYRYYWLSVFVLIILVTWRHQSTSASSDYCHDSLQMAYQYALQTGDIDSVQAALILCLEDAKTCCKHFSALMKQWKAADKHFLGCDPTHCKTQYFEGETCPSFMHPNKFERR